MKTKILFKTIALLIVIIFVSFTFFSSCQKDNADNDYNVEIPDTFNVISISDPADAIARIRFLQEYLSYSWGINLTLPNIMSWEYKDLSYEFAQYRDFYFTPDMQFLTDFWANPYKSIHLCNLFLSETSALDNPDMNLYKGQVHFYRAFAYFNLVRTFGKFYPDKNINDAGVPIIGLGASEIQRASISEVYNLIISDLDSAYNLLPGPGVEVPINKYAALAVEAKTHIWFQKYSEAEPLLLEIIQSNKFSLLQNFGDNFNGLSENGPESIYELQFYEDGNTYYSSNYKPAFNYSQFYTQDQQRFMLNDHIIDQFGVDKRGKETYYSLEDTMYRNGNVFINEDGQHYIKKYAHLKTGNYHFAYGINPILIRLADIYLLYSETQIVKNNLNEALQYINMVRARSGNALIALNGMTSSQLMDVLRKERLMELCGEGQYWYDLVRWDIVDEFIPNSVYFIRGIHEAFPIPSIIIENNLGIIQNPGY